MIWRFCVISLRKSKNQLFNELFSEAKLSTNMCRNESFKLTTFQTIRCLKFISLNISKKKWNRLSLVNQQYVFLNSSMKCTSTNTTHSIHSTNSYSSKLKWSNGMAKMTIKFQLPILQWPKQRIKSERKELETFSQI